MRTPHAALQPCTLSPHQVPPRQAKTPLQDAPWKAEGVDELECERNALPWFSRSSSGSITRIWVSFFSSSGNVKAYEATCGTRKIELKGLSYLGYTQALVLCSACHSASALKRQKWCLNALTLHQIMVYKQGTSVLDVMLCSWDVGRLQFKITQ